MGEKKELATFAGGCFWCMVSPFEEQPGILGIVSGYTGGHTENPTYEEVCSDTTGHYEAVHIGSKLIRLTQEANLMIEDNPTARPFFIIMRSSGDWQRSPSRRLLRAGVFRRTS